MLVRPTEPPSMQVLIGDDDFVQIEDNPTSNNRIDGIAVTNNGTFVLLRGKGGVEPEADPLPEGAMLVARIKVLPGTTVIFSDDIALNPSITGEQPTVSNNGYVLDMNDPHEALLAQAVELQRKKRSDYASSHDPYKNFRENAEMLGIPGYGPLEDCFSMILRKIGRIKNLRGRPPMNESVIDSYLDLFVYSWLAYGLAVEAAHGADNLPALPAPEEVEF